LIQNYALAWIEARAGDSLDSIFGRARSRTRKLSQDPSHYGQGVDSAATAADDDAGRPAWSAPATKKQVRAQVEADLGLSRRTAQRAIARQLDRARMGDLFAEGGAA